MKSTHCIVGLLLAAAAVPALAQTTGNVPPNKTVPVAKDQNPAQTKADDSYSLGLMMGTQLHGYGISANSVNSLKLLAGIKAALGGKTATPEDAQKLQNLIETSRKTVGRVNAVAAARFLTENKHKPGIITTASGLQYKVLRAGAGASPKANDMVTVDYEGRLLNGQVFDSSYKRGEPATFPVGGLIKGWEEGLQLMKPGSKVEFYIPPDLGYGEHGQPPIPPESLLVFTVELKSVKSTTPVAAPAPAPKQ